VEGTCQTGKSSFKQENITAKGGADGTLQLEIEDSPVSHLTDRGIARAVGLLHRDGATTMRSALASTAPTRPASLTLTSRLNGHLNRSPKPSAARRKRRSDWRTCVSVENMRSKQHASEPKRRSRYAPKLSSVVRVCGVR
jgi:hypothetical protein